MSNIVTADMFGMESDYLAQVAANYMAVTPAYFSKVSCEGNTIMGLLSPCDTNCDAASKNPTFNNCARKGLWSNLYRVQQETEIKIHWTLSPRYVDEIIQIIPGRNIQTKFGGISEVNVAELISDVDYGPASYSVFLVRGLAPVLDGTQWYVDVPLEVVDNPGKLMLRAEDGTGDPSNGESILPENWTKKPQRVTVGPDRFWRIWIPGRSAQGGAATFSAIHCELSYFDAPDPTGLACNGVLAPVYPGTVQRIPVIRAEALDSGEIRYWVYTALMIAPGFDEAYVSIADGEFYKFIETVEFKCFGEIQQLAVVTKRVAPKITSVGVIFPEFDDGCDGEPCDTTDVYACATIIDSTQGIVGLEEVTVTIDEETGLPARDDDGNVIFTSLAPSSTYQGEPVYVRLRYKTDPNATGLQLSAAIETLRRGIAARVAAEVPLEECGCEVKIGYFYAMRQLYSDTTYTPTGATIVKLQYGDLLGQQIYSVALGGAPKAQRVVKL